MSPKNILDITNFTRILEKILDMVMIIKILLDIIEENMKRGVNTRHEDESNDDELRT